MNPNKLHDVIVRICTSYRYKDELSRARVTKLVYLSDWVSSLHYGGPITNTQWVFNHYGPYVGDVPATVASSPVLMESPETNAFGSPKRVITAVPGAVDGLSDSERAVVDAVLGHTESMTFTKFIDYVYDSYPIRASKRYDTLDLGAFAAQAQQQGIRY